MELNGAGKFLGFNTEFLSIPPFVRLLIPTLIAFTLVIYMCLRMAKPDPDWSHLNLGYIAQMHPAGWVMIVTGLTGFLLGAWVWALKPKNSAALLFALSGLATLAFTYAPLVDLFVMPTSTSIDTAMSRLNMYGASAFGIVTSVLLMIYPTRLKPANWLAPIFVLVFLSWTFWASRDIANVGNAVQQITLTEMLCIIGFSIWQIRASSGSPDKRAIAIWLSACVIVGSGPFITLVALPSVLGFSPIILPVYAFIFFNLLYIGFAIGLLRLRLFDLGDWAFQLLFHTALAIGFVAVDLVLISALAIQSNTALIFTGIGMAIAYLPLRGFIWNRVSGSKQLDQAEIFKSVLRTGLQPSGDTRALSWVDLIKRTFSPLDVSQHPDNPVTVSISSDGQSLTLPAAADAPAIKVTFKKQGRALFTPRDKAMAEQLVTLVNQVEGSREAYDRGVIEERSRIGRDIHDNIGAQLLQALHSDAPQKKNDMIRDSLADLRGVISHDSSEELNGLDMLADLRVETYDRVSPHNIDLDWSIADFEHLDMSGQSVYALRSVIREAVSNVIKHANATTLSISLNIEDTFLLVKIIDNGQGIKLSPQSTRPGHGNGMQNMQDRVESLGGRFDCKNTDSGTHITAHFKLESV